jgi:hypothetical protein
MSPRYNPSSLSDGASRAFLSPGKIIKIGESKFQGALCGESLYGGGQSSAHRLHIFNSVAPLARWSVAARLRKMSEWYRLRAPYGLRLFTHTATAAERMTSVVPGRVRPKLWRR